MLQTRAQEHFTPATPVSTDRQELVARFARSVAKRGTNAPMIGSDNRGLGWIPIDEGVTSGQALSVEVDDDVLALDADEHERGCCLEHELAPHLLDCRLSPVLVASGRKGHRHLFVRVANAETGAARA